MAIDIENERKYLKSQVEKAKQTGNKGLEDWARKQAKSYGISLDDSPSSSSGGSSGSSKSSGSGGSSGGSGSKKSSSGSSGGGSSSGGSSASSNDLVNRLQSDIARVEALRNDPASVEYYNRNFGGIDAYLASQRQRLQQAQVSGGAVGGGVGGGYGQVGANAETQRLLDEIERLRKNQYTPDDFRQAISDYSFPYEQAIRDLIGSAPQYTPPSEEEMMEQARQWAQLQINPQIAALQRAVEQANQALKSRKQQVEASYTGMEDTVNRAMQEAALRALESSIARGGGQSGAVEWLTSKLQQPVAEQFTSAQAQKAAELADIASRQALLVEQQGTQEQELEGRSGLLEANRLAELRNLAQAQATGNWQQVLQSTQNLANMATQAQQFAQSQAYNLLPYFMTTEAQRQAQPYDWTNLIGQVPEVGPTYTSSAYTVPLRDYAAEHGLSIGYDPATGEVIINGRRYSGDVLAAYGGRLVNGRWQIPESAFNSLLGGY